ncbi:MAG: phosphate ABC transporter permease PstA [Gaiellaceae bacterium]|jgi:phosphate transport system permease protein
MVESAISLRTSGRLRRRQLLSHFMGALAITAALLAVSVLAIVVISVGRRGAGALNLAFFTQNEPVGWNASGGGVLFAIVGTGILVGIATLIALPLGVLVAIYVSEIASPRLARVARLALDITNGIPTIVIGVFVYVMVVQNGFLGIIPRGQSALAGSIAFAIIMLPLVARATEEVLLLVPASHREASLALGASRWRTTLKVVVPSALGGIFTGTTLAIARAAGETAPLLFLSSLGSNNQVATNPLHPMWSLTLVIFEYADYPDPASHEKAWAAAFILMCFVLLTSLAAKLALARYRRKLGG